MDINYKQKYLKYKYKYLQLQQQGGEQNTVDSVLVTHNGRIRCLLDTMGVPASETITDKKGKEKKEEIRFMNCAILLLRITKDGYTISLEHEGELAKDSIEKAEKEKRKYYAISSQGTIYTTFKGTGTLSKPLSLLQLTPDQIGDNTYNFYIVRHGDGLHNSMGFWKKATSSDVTDAVLSTDGVKQAAKAREFLKDIKVDNLYVSDLKRTRQTLGELIEGRTDIKGKLVVVLPCAEELVYIKGNNCDAKQGKNSALSFKKITSALSYENKALCPDEKKKCDSLNDEQREKDICCTVNGLTIDWSFYRTFYGEGTRMKEGKNSQKCKDTNMIKQAFEHMKSIRSY